MTTNSFGTALPRFDFPPPEPPVISRYARVAKVFPLAAFAATGVAAWYYINAPNQKTPVSANPFPGAAAMHINQAAQSQPLTQRTEPKVDGAWKPFS
ncbi:hypothetical protein EDB80DRAFT_893874 [Ilyonectria destructans]|nr:hypothetical protein EDB80DRAFT_893874 [Ilyonectria destructans]